MHCRNMQAASRERLTTEARAALTRAGQLFRSVAQLASEGQAPGDFPPGAQRALMQWSRALCARAALADAPRVSNLFVMCEGHLLCFSAVLQIPVLMNAAAGSDLSALGTTHLIRCVLDGCKWQVSDSGELDDATKQAAA